MGGVCSSTTDSNEGGFDTGHSILAVWARSRYGQFCVILKAEFFEGDVLAAYLKSDSLKTYMPTETDFRETALRQEAATHQNRHHLAAVKHAAALKTATPTDWAEMVCNNDEFVEAVFVKNFDCVINRRGSRE